MPEEREHGQGQDRQPPTRPGARPGLDRRRRLVLALEAVPVMADPAARGQVLALLPPEIHGSLPRSPITRVDLVGVVETCLAFPGGLTLLWQAVEMVDSGSYALRELAEALAEMPGFDGGGAATG
ncbi:hypothetical protein ACFV1F_02905 [Streptomyces sp. NPDC059590]|uniref:effector-associated domain 2-containing protein n=1 Tax=unclassified Streptomyces TaxID=2593676 RepID=UPI00367A8475